MRPGAGFLIEGLSGDGANALGGAASVQVTKAGESIPLADTNFVEASWILC